MQSTTSSTTLSKLLLAPYLRGLDSEQQLEPKGQDYNYAGPDKTLDATEKSLGAMSGDSGNGGGFWLTSDSTWTVVIAVGSVAILVGIVGLAWKFVRRSSGGMLSGSKSNSVPPSDLEHSPGDEDGIYKRELGIYSSIKDDVGKDKKSTLHSSLNDIDRNPDPFVVDLEFPKCSINMNTPATANRRKSSSVGQCHGSPL